MLNPLGSKFGGIPFPSQPTAAAGEQEPYTRPSSEEFSPTRASGVDDLMHRIHMAHINYELMRGSGSFLPQPQPEQPPAEEPPLERVENGHSSLGIMHDHNTSMGVGNMEGPRTADELWGGYLIPKHNPWR